MTAAIVTRDMSSAARSVDRILFFDQGVIAFPRSPGAVIVCIRNDGTGSFVTRVRG
jgi:ABC-type polar amino acid transport system ATPase subunit